MEAPDLTALVPIPGVWKRLELVEERLIEVTEAENPFLTKVARHLIEAGGKRYRPLVAQVAAETGDPSGNGPVEAGVAVELVHVGSLYHDDVIDEAEERRGQPSANALWDNTTAILGGDFLLARASEVAAPLGTEAVSLLARTYATLCEGQVLELQLAYDLNHGPPEYFDVIGGKTAVLIRTAAHLGALAAGADRGVIEAVADWAWEMGIVFQMTDDVLDFVATEEFLGKPVGFDVAEGKFTLPVIYALEGDRRAELSQILGADRPYPIATLERVVDIVRSSGHVDRVLDEARGRLARAAAAVERLPSGPVPAILRGLGEFLIDRVDEARGLS